MPTARATGAVARRLGRWARRPGVRARDPLPNVLGTSVRRAPGLVVVGSSAQPWAPEDRVTTQPDSQNASTVEESLSPRTARSRAHPIAPSAALGESPAALGATSPDRPRSQSRAAQLSQHQRGLPKDGSETDHRMSFAPVGMSSPASRVHAAVSRVRRGCGEGVHVLAVGGLGKRRALAAGATPTPADAVGWPRSYRPVVSGEYGPRPRAHRSIAAGSGAPPVPDRDDR